MTTLQFQVRKTALNTTRTVTVADTPLAEGQVLVRIDRFAYTANNITYAAFGEAMQYWQFFPAAAQAEGDAGWGVIPVWGFGTVVQSRCEGVAEGERLYGYWPMASHATLTPGHISASGFVDAAPHRAALHGVYNRYARCSADPYYTPADEAAQALLRPLFMTAFLIDDFLADNAFFGATPMAASEGAARATLLVSSASSKTACATALHLSQRAEVDVVGLTAPGKVDYCQSLGIYKRVLTYEQIDAVDAHTPCIYVDFAGNSSLRRAIHQRFQHLAYDCSIGGTHVDQLGNARDLPGPRPVLFFAPAQAKKRSADWGADGFGQRLLAGWRSYMQRVADPRTPWLVVQEHAGIDAVRAAHALVLSGQSDPRLGHMLSLR